MTQYKDVKSLEQLKSQILEQLNFEDISGQLVVLAAALCRGRMIVIDARAWAATVPAVGVTSRYSAKDDSVEL